MKKSALYILCFVMSLIMFSDLHAQNYQRVTNLPHIYINTFNNARITSKNTYIYCTLIYVDEDHNVMQYDSVEIRGRGNSTWGLAKKPYKIKFPIKEKFLGKGYANARQWTLLANAGDKTLIRNAITSEMGNWLGLKNSPAAKFIDLTLNGVYQGNYQISDQVQVRPHRVNITEQDYPLTETSDITGGYLLEVDGFADGNTFYSSKGLPIRIHYPEEEEITPSQNSYIKNYINNFEKVLFSADFADPETGYRQYVDSASLINLYIATEVSANIDGFWSTYFYKDQQDPKLYFGPLWDYDIAYDNDYRISETERKLMVDSGYGDARKWFKQFWLDTDWFAVSVNERYEKALEDGLVDFLYHKIDSLAELIDRSQQLNYEKWGINNRMYHEIVLYSTYQEYIDELKQFISEHTEYLKEAFNERKPYIPPPPPPPTPSFVPENYYYKIKNVRTENVIDILSVSDTTYSDDYLPKSGVLVCSWNNIEDRLSEYWQFTPMENGSFFITNNFGLALNDPTEGECTPTTNLNTPLNVADPDSTDTRQLWYLTPQGTDGYYNLTNLYSQHTANLSGGGYSNGTQIISYTTDDRNAVSNNRLWYIEKTNRPLPVDSIPSDTIPVDTIPVDTIPVDTIPVDTIPVDTVPVIDFVNTIINTDYALVYNPIDYTLRFAGEDPSQLTFEASLYSLSGRKMGSFRANERYSVAHLPKAVYIVTWKTNGKIRKTKFLR